MNIIDTRRFGEYIKRVDESTNPDILVYNNDD